MARQRRQMRATSGERIEKNRRTFVHRNCTRPDPNYLILLNSRSNHHGTNCFGARSPCASYPARFVSQQTWGSQPGGQRRAGQMFGRRTCLARDVLSVSSTTLFGSSLHKKNGLHRPVRIVRWVLKTAEKCSGDDETSGTAPAHR